MLPQKGGKLRLAMLASEPLDPEMQIYKKNYKKKYRLNPKPHTAVPEAADFGPGSTLNDKIGILGGQTGLRFELTRISFGLTGSGLSLQCFPSYAYLCYHL